jgi:hypothetical protein
MKNAKSKNDLEARIVSKINEIVSELKVEGKALTKSIEGASKKIAKHIAKKLYTLQKKADRLKKNKASDAKKIVSAKTEKTKKALPVKAKPAKKSKVVARSAPKSKVTSTVPEPAIAKKPQKPAGKKIS